jgi:hypothetical protein
MRAMSLAAIATMGIATTPIPASAANQIITESFSVTIPNSTVPNVSQPDAQFESTPFPLFADSTGLLQSVTVTVSGAVKVVSLIEDPDVLIYLRGVTSVIGQGVAAGTTDVMISINDQTGSYVGTGNGQVQVTLNTGDPPNTDLIESVGPLDGVVTYTYKPRTLAAIPEPSTWAMMLVGFAGLGFAGYRASGRAAAPTSL